MQNVICYEVLKKMQNCSLVCGACNMECGDCEYYTDRAEENEALEMAKALIKERMDNEKINN